MKFVGQINHLSNQKCITPASEHDAAIFDKLKTGSFYKVDARKARNPDHHRKAFALINMIYENQEKYLTLEDMLVELKLKTGWYMEHIRSNGELIYVPKSISFADMNQTDFETFYERIVVIAIREYGLEDAMEFV